MDKIRKFLAKLSNTEREKLLKIFADIGKLQIEKYDIKKLEGFDALYRLRKGSMRILFVKRGSKGEVIRVVFRKDAYK